MKGKEQEQPNQNKNLKQDSAPKVLMNIYGILAVLFVLIPEWIAELTLSIADNDLKDEIIDTRDLWRKNPYLYVTSMSIKELRLFAYQLKLYGYSSDSKNSLTKRVLKKLKKRYPNT